MNVKFDSTISVHNDISTDLHVIKFALYKLCKNTNVTFYYPDQQMRVGARARAHTHTQTHTLTILYILTFV